MAMIALRPLLDHAAEHDYGVPAFNINNIEQIQAIMLAAEATASPVILQASAGAGGYAGEAFLKKMIEAAFEHAKTHDASRERPTRLSVELPSLFYDSDGEIVRPGVYWLRTIEAAIPCGDPNHCLLFFSREGLARIDLTPEQCRKRIEEAMAS